MQKFHKIVLQKIISTLSAGNTS